jgi:hypothetical protein
MQDSAAIRLNNSGGRYPHGKQVYGKKFFEPNLNMQLALILSRAS